MKQSRRICRRCGKNDIVTRLRGPGIADYELDLGVAEDAALAIEHLRLRVEKLLALRGRTMKNAKA